VNASRKLIAAFSLLALASPALAQRGQYDDRAQQGGRDNGYDRDGRYDRDRDDRGRNDRDNGRRGRADALPGGSWAQSCRRADISGRTLSAQCKDDRGKWRDAQINPRQCQTGRVGNRFGRLVCE
jgi:hypothetical protein